MDKLEDSHAEDEVESFIEEEDDDQRENNDQRREFRKENNSIERERAEGIHHPFGGEARYVPRER